MPIEPPRNLVSLLQRLRLATSEQVQSVAPRVRRLAGEMPDFESVWVDALAQARILTPFQAARINTGDGGSLTCGSYVLMHAISSPFYAACYCAKHVETGRIVRLYLVQRPTATVPAIAAALRPWIDQMAPLRGPATCVAEDAAISNQQVWAICATTTGKTAVDWMVENGRFPPHVVLHIAHEMLARLVELEQLQLVHGDIGASGLVLDSTSHVYLPMPGLRPVVRPSEGYSFSELSPEAYDYLAPERISTGAPASIASDIYACGCLWWHLLAGRVPFAGGNSLSKLKAVHAAKAIDVKTLVPDVPDELARAVTMCMQSDPAARPQSFARLIEILGPPTRSGATALTRALDSHHSPWELAVRAKSRRRTVRRKLPVTLAVAAVLLCAVMALRITWHRDGHVQNTVATVASTEKAPGSLPSPPSGKRSAIPTAVRHQTSVAESNPADSQVRQIGAIETASIAAQKDLILPDEHPLAAADLRLGASARVRGRGGRRPRIVVADEALVVACEGVSFENVDFVYEGREKSRSLPLLALLVVQANAIEFRGCSFSSTTVSPPIAIVWHGAEDQSDTARGELSFCDCAFRDVAAVVDVQGPTSLSVELQNALCVASGPIVRLRRPPRADESVAISLNHLTTRGDTCVLECRYGRLQKQIGEVTISAIECAFDGNPRGALLVFNGSESPDRMLNSIRWTGEGSLMAPHLAMAMWRMGSNRQEVLSEDDLEVAGLVRSQVEFAGGVDGPLAASRLTRWQVPLRSADPPGVNTMSLSLPKR